MVTKHKFPHAQLKKLGFVKETSYNGDESKLEQYVLWFFDKNKFFTEKSIRVHREYFNKTLLDLAPNYHKYNKKEMGTEWELRSEACSIGVQTGFTYKEPIYKYAITKISDMPTLKRLIELLETGK